MGIFNDLITGLIKIVVSADKVKKLGINTFIKKNFGEVGKVLDLKFDKNNRTINLVVELKGEIEPVKIDINNYDITEGYEVKLIIEDIEINKEWMNVIAKKLLVENKMQLPLPEQARDFLSILK